MTNTAQNNIIPMTKTAAATSKNTVPGVSNQDLERLLVAYNRVLGNMPAQIGRYLTDLMRVMDVDVIIYAINETAWAKSPSPRYLKSILDRYENCELFTMEDLLQDKRDFDSRRACKQLEWWER